MTHPWNIKAKEGATVYLIFYLLDTNSVKKDCKDCFCSAVLVLGFL